MADEFSRTELLLGSEAIKRLSQSRVIVFGIGGVGSYCVEALARSGIGTIAMVDNDMVSISNINRQLVATHKTLGKYKVDVASEHILDINPSCNVKTFNCFFSEENAGKIDLTEYDYVIDAIDSVSSKVHLIVLSKKLGIPIISSMGAGNKLDPTAFKIADIYKTEMCPLAKTIRKHLRDNKVSDLKVVFSNEPVKIPIGKVNENNGDRLSVPGSVAFVPSVAGLILAGEVIKELSGYFAS